MMSGLSKLWNICEPATSRLFVAFSLVVMAFGCYATPGAPRSESSQEETQTAHGLPLAAELPEQAWLGVALAPQAASDMCMDGVVALGQNVTLKPCAGSVLQRFKWEEGSFALAGNRCLGLDLAGGPAAVGSPVVLQTCDANNTAQLWAYAAGSLYPEVAGRTTPPSLCLSTVAQKTSAMTGLVLAACTGTSAAIPWQMMARDANNQPTGFTLTSQIGRSICLGNAGNTLVNGTPLVQNVCNGNLAQNFITSGANIVLHSMCMTVGTAVSAGGTFVEFDACQATNTAQSWTFEHGQIRATQGAHAGQCLDLAGKVASAAAKIDVIACTAKDTLATTPQVHWVVGAEIVL